MIFSKIIFIFILLQTVIYAQAEPLEKVKLQLQWKYQFQFAGFIMAKELGYYRDIGLDVEMIEYQNADTIQELEDGHVDYAMSNTIIAHRDNKLSNVTLLATYFQRSPLILVTQPEIKSVLNLKNKAVMIGENDRLNSSLTILLDYFDINPKNTKIVEQTYNINDFIDKKVDACTAFRSNELFDFDKKKIPYNIIDPVEYGFTTSANNIFTTHKKLQNNPRQVKNFLSATKKGWKYALENIDETARLIHTKYQPNKSLEHLVYEGKVTKELMLLNLYDIGEINREFVLQNYKLLLKNNKIDAAQAPDKIMVEEIYKKDTFELTKALIKNLIEKIDYATAIFILIIISLILFLFFNIKSEHKKRLLVEKELDKSNQRYMSIFKSNLAVQLIIDPQTQKIVDCNKSAEVFYGYSHDEFLKLNINQINIMSLEEIKNEMESAKLLKKSKFNVKHRLSNGDIRDVEVYLGPFEMENKTYLYSIIFDVTEQKKLELIKESMQEAYKSERDKGQLYLDTAEVLLIALDNQARVTMLNKKGEELLGYTQEELLGKVWFEIGVLPKKIETQIRQLFKNIINMTTLPSTPVEHLVITKSGKEVMVSFRASLLFDKENKVSGVLSSGSDITQRVEAEKALQKQHDFLQTVINSVGSGIMVINKDYTVSLMNSVAKEMIDERILQNPSLPKCYEISHQQNMPCDGISHPCPLSMAIDSKKQTKVLHVHSSSSGKEKIVELIAMPLFDENGEVYAIIEAAHDITELKETQDKLKYQAEHDSLTGLPNRVLFTERINEFIHNARRYNEKIAVLFIDLDHFKDINDSLGHRIGDIFLETVSKKLTLAIRQSDTVARLGGDEFAIIINRFYNFDVVTSVIQNIMLSFNTPLLIKEHEIYASLSIGIAIYPDDAIDAETLIKNADAAMYKVKNSGRNNYQFYTADMTERAFERVVLETQLRQSIEKNQLEVYYQIQMNAKENSIIGMEALVRWNHPDMGVVSPAKFIPLAEDTGFILQIDKWVMKESITQFEKWNKDGLNPGVLSLNLSMLLLERDEFIQDIKDIVKELDIDTSWLSFEVTETQIMKNPDKSIKKLNELNKLGIKLSIDDFGTGHSSLSYLKKLPINKLKIDQSFIRDIPDDLDDVEITKTIISMAKNLKLHVIAEGVETKQQRDFLLENDCHEIQGYFYHKPSPAVEIEKSLKVHFKG